MSPVVIAHRGASGYVPEHTLEAYRLAIEQGADYIEPDLVMTRDGVLVARHENEIGGTTDVAEHPAFACRRTVRVIDGVAVEGWFTEDFTLQELKTLRARERIPHLRPANTRFDGQFEIPTFEEILALVCEADERRASAARAAGKPPPPRIGIYPETKHPSYFASLGLAMEEPLLRELERWGYTDRSAPVFIQSFEMGNLRRLRHMTRLALVQLIAPEGAPYDLVRAGDSRTYADLITPKGLEEVAGYADAIGPEKSLIVRREADGTLGAPTGLVERAHAQGLLVHGWTFRAENAFLPVNLRSGEDPAAIGDLRAEILACLRAGMDGLFTDHPDLGVNARDAFLAGR